MNGCATGVISGFNPCIGRNSSGAVILGASRPSRVCVSIRVLVGTAQEQPRRFAVRGLLGGFNPCIGRNSSGAWPKPTAATTNPCFNPCIGRNSSGATASGADCSKPACFNPCIGRNSSGAPLRPAPPCVRRWVSIRVLVGTAQELHVPVRLVAAHGQFQSVYWSEQLRSLAQPPVGHAYCMFQSVYWSEQLRSPPCG